MGIRVRYVIAAITGTILIGHSFSYRPFLLESGLAGVLDPVGTISPLPYGTYYVGIGTVYVGAALFRFYTTKRSISIYLPIVSASLVFIASVLGMLSFWEVSSAPTDIDWFGGFYVVAAAQVAFLLLIVPSIENSSQRVTMSIKSWDSIYKIGWGLSAIALLPMIGYGLFGIVLGGWNLFRLFSAILLIMWNSITGSLLYLLIR
jgi:hypothetical protein